MGSDEQEDSLVAFASELRSAARRTIAERLSNQLVGSAPVNWGPQMVVAFSDLAKVEAVAAELSVLHRSWREKDQVDWATIQQIINAGVDAAKKK